jgi:polysaccharide deacetylase family protein (PEP-CTERM system associated)
MNIMSIDVEEWFHILGSPETPAVGSWERMDSRFRENLETLLSTLEETRTHATLFWVGWLAERSKTLVRRCHEAGHEIASHGYHHVTCGQVGQALFQDDITRARQVLEDILGEPVTCFRTPGFAVDGCQNWCFEVIRAAGYLYDSSVPLARMARIPARRQGAGWYVLDTQSGPLVEVPVSSMMLAPGVLWTFGGGYLRVTPRRVLRWVSALLRRAGRPLVIYVHPRDIDAESPCLHLSPRQRLKFVVNRQTTIEKLRMLLTAHEFRSVREYIVSAGLASQAKIANPQNGVDQGILCASNLSTLHLGQASVSGRAVDQLTTALP